MRINKKKIDKAIKKQKKNPIEIEFIKKEIGNHTFKRKRNCFIAIILKQSKDALVCYVPNCLSIFFIDGHAYYNVAGGKYINTTNMISVYLEGAVLPLEHSYIKYESIYTLYYDNENKPVTDIADVPKKDLALLVKNDKGEHIKTTEGYIVKEVLERIKGLEFDSKTSDVLFEGNMTDRLAYDKNAKMLPLLTMFNIIMIILEIAILGVILFFNQ